MCLYRKSHPPRIFRARRSGSHPTARFCRARSWRDGGRGNDPTQPLDDDDLRLSHREIDDATLWRQPGCPVQLSTEAGASHTSRATPFDTTDRMEPDDARYTSPCSNILWDEHKFLCVSVAGPDGLVESRPEWHTELVMATRGCYGSLGNKAAIRWPRLPPRTPTDRRHRAAHRRRQIPHSTAGATARSTRSIETTSGTGAWSGRAPSSGGRQRHAAPQRWRHVYPEPERRHTGPRRCNRRSRLGASPRRTGRCRRLHAPRPGCSRRTAARRERALKQAKGLSAGAEDEPFDESTRRSGNDKPAPRTFTQAEADLISSIRRTSAGGSVPEWTGRRLDGVEEPLSGLQRPCAADRLLGDVVRSVHCRAAESSARWSPNCQPIGWRCWPSASTRARHGDRVHRAGGDAKEQLAPGPFRQP